MSINITFARWMNGNWPEEFSSKRSPDHIVAIAGRCDDSFHSKNSVLKRKEMNRWKALLILMFLILSCFFFSRIHPSLEYNFRCVFIWEIYLQAGESLQKSGGVGNPSTFCRQSCHSDLLAKLDCSSKLVKRARNGGSP